jgi:hypothetical protein
VQSQGGAETETPRAGLGTLGIPAPAGLWPPFFLHFLFFQSSSYLFSFHLLVSHIWFFFFLVNCSQEIKAVRNGGAGRGQLEDACWDAA